jgi:hypothetical protein
MKKICMIIFSVALFTSFATCSQAKKEESTVKEDVEIVVPEAVEEVKVETPEVKPADALKEFQAFAKEYTEAFNNIKKDYPKFQKLAGQSVDKVAAVDKFKAQFNKRQMAEYQAARDAVVKVNNGGK